MRKSIKSLMAVLFVSVFACHVFAADGVVTFVKGKVEVKRGDSWVALNVGDKVKQSEVINTGFQSEAKVKLMDSILYLGPVTRVTLDTLASSSDRDKVNVFLTTGSVRSKVNRTEAKRVNYTVRTPIAVASVRGTDWSMNCLNDVNCYEGAVAVIPVELLKELIDESSKSDDEAEDEDKKEDEEEEESSEDEEQSESKEESGDESEAEDDSGEGQAESDSGESAGDSGDVDSTGSEDMAGDKAGVDTDSFMDNADTSMSDFGDTMQGDTSIGVDANIPEISDFDFDLNDTDTLQAFEDALDLPTAGVIVEADMSVQINDPFTMTAPSHSAESKADKVLSGVSTESTKKTNDGTQKNEAVQNVIKTGTIGVNIKTPDSGSLEIQVTVPSN